MTIDAQEWQMHHLLAPLPAHFKTPSLYQGTDIGRASHNEKIEFRVVVPILGVLTHTGRWTVVFWNHIAGLVVFWLLALFAAEAVGDRTSGALFIFGLAPTFFGFWFFNDFVCGDGIAQALLLLTLASMRRWWLAAPLFMAAAFTDERCLTCIPLLVVCIAMRTGQGSNRKPWSNYVGVIIGALGWASFRWCLASQYHLTTGRTGLLSIEVLKYHFSVSLPWVLLAVFGASWLLWVIALAGIAAKGGWMRLLQWVAAFGCAAAPAFAVWDFNRSMTYCFPVLLVSLATFRNNASLLRNLLAGIFLANSILMAGSLFRTAFFALRAAGIPGMR